MKYNSGQMGSTLMGSLQKYYLLTDKAFGYSRQNYVPLCVLYFLSKASSTCLEQTVLEWFDAVHIKRVSSSSLR